MAILPQPSDQDWDFNMERGANPAAMSADVSSNHNDSPEARASTMEPLPALLYDEVALVPRNKDDTATEVTEPSASEEQLQEAVSEQK